jgi:hypothetical protein
MTYDITNNISLESREDVTLAEAAKQNYSVSRWLAIVQK